MLKQNAYETYKQQSVMTMTQTEMLTMLYDGILKEIYAVSREFDREPLDLAEINRRLQKTQKIMNYLASSLEKENDIAKNLHSLYDYCNWILTQANIKKEPHQLNEVVDIIAGLRESYIQADRNARMHA